MAKLNPQNAMSHQLAGWDGETTEAAATCGAKTVEVPGSGAIFWCCSADSLAALRMLAPRWTSTDRKVRGASSRHFWGLSR